MKIIAFILMSVVCAIAQPIPRAATFRWDAPTNMAQVIAYELQWGEQNKDTVPLYQLEYEVWQFPYTFRQEVSVRSVTSMTNSDPTSIIIYNVIASLEESRDGTNWSPIQSHNFIGEMEARSTMMRVKLSTE